MSEKQEMRTSEFTGKVNEMRESPWLASEDLEGLDQVTVKIAKCFKHNNVTFEAGRTEKQKFSIAFEGKERKLILNATNQDTLKALFGSDTKEWIGKKIILYVDPKVNMHGKTVKGIRIRRKKVD